MTAAWSPTSYLLQLHCEWLLDGSSRCVQSIRLEIWVRSSTTNEGNRQAGPTKSWIGKWGSKMYVPKWVKILIFCTLVRSRFQKKFILSKKFTMWNVWSGLSSLLTFPIGFPGVREIHYKKTRQKRFSKMFFKTFWTFNFPNSTCNFPNSEKSPKNRKKLQTFQISQLWSSIWAFWVAQMEF